MTTTDAAAGTMGAIPQRIQRKRSKGWRMPEGAVYVGRPTIFGNPFTHDDAAQAVEAYRRFLTDPGRSYFELGPGKLYLARNAHPDSLHWTFTDRVRKALQLIRGKDLACWCAIDEPCHADVLLELANR